MSLAAPAQLAHSAVQCSAALACRAINSVRSCPLLHSAHRCSAKGLPFGATISAESESDRRIEHSTALQSFTTYVEMTSKVWSADPQLNIFNVHDFLQDGKFVSLAEKKQKAEHDGVKVSTLEYRSNGAVYGRHKPSRDC